MANTPNTPNQSTAVMARRYADYSKNLDYFPTPPSATHSLINMLAYANLISDIEDLKIQTCLEPAAGGGHMVDILDQYFDDVSASDVKDYERGYPVQDFLSPQFDPPQFDWVITNPPFKLAEAFIKKSFNVARYGIAMLCRLSFLESTKRYNSIFEHTPPSNVFVFVERVNMRYGRLANKSDNASATAYAWFVWNMNAMREHKDTSKHTYIDWIPSNLYQRKLATT